MGQVIEFPGGQNMHTPVDALRLCVAHCFADETINETAFVQLSSALDALEEYVNALNEQDS